MNIRIKTAFVCKKTLFSFLALFLLIPATSVGAIYKWVDEQGKTHYGNQRPATNQAEKMKLKIKEPAAPGKGTKKDKKDGAKKPEEKVEQKRLPDTIVDAPISEKEKRRLCEQAKADIATIQAKGRIRERDDKGNSYYLTDKQRAKRLADAKKDASELCK